MAEKKIYDYIFTGFGASTCILLREMDIKGLLKKKKSLIIDPNTKNENDKTFCFWAKKTDDIYKEYQDIISNEWSKIQISDFEAKSIAPLFYFHINSIDLYNSAKKIIKKNNIISKIDSVSKINENKITEVIVGSDKYLGDKIIDCRTINMNHLTEEKIIYQSFIGFKVKLKSKNFDSNTFNLMDFRVEQKEGTQFVYTLPYSDDRGLVELTRFADNIIEKNNSELILDKYIKNHFGEYELLTKEIGLIPMSTKKFSNNNNKKIIELGTRAGNIKPSTGYGFKKMYNHSKYICNIDLKKSLVKTKRKFQIYDELLLIILNKWPKYGKEIFLKLFKNSDYNLILKFLDEKTNLRDDIKIFSKLQIPLFLKSLMLWSYFKIKKLIIPCSLVIFTLLPSYSDKTALLNDNQIIFMSFGLLLIGIPHGALDYYSGFFNSSKKLTFSYILLYILLMIPVFILWVLDPYLSLILFILYSSWHFGQTDMKYWNIKSPLFSILWGLTIFTYIFSNHFKEFEKILRLIGINDNINITILTSISSILLVASTAVSIYKRKVTWFLLCLFLYLSHSLSLVYTFGLYFILHHSVIGWFDIKKNIKISHIKMYLKAVPFNLGAIFIYLIFTSKINENKSDHISWFFVFLSCISFPHIISMNFFYKKDKSI